MLETKYITWLLSRYVVNWSVMAAASQYGFLHAVYGMNKSAIWTSFAETLIASDALICILLFIIIM